MMNRLGLIVVGVSVAIVLLQLPSISQEHRELAATLRRDSGGWTADERPLELVKGMRKKLSWCDFAVENASLSSADFLKRYRHRRPVLVKGGVKRLDEWRKDAMIDRLGSTQYGATSDVVRSGGGQLNHVTMSGLISRVENHSAPDDVFAFDTEALKNVSIEVPNFAKRAFRDKRYIYWPILSVGPSRSGLSSHTHGDTWLAVAHGAKRWLVAAPGSTLVSSQAMGKLHPLAPSRFLFSLADKEIDHVEGCLQRAGDVVYVPAGWKHATLNVGETVGFGEQQVHLALDRYHQSVEALEDSPRDVEALHGAGVAAAHIGIESRDESKLREAADFLRRAVAERPLQPDISILLGEVLASLGDMRSALLAVDSCHQLYESYRTERSSDLLGSPNDVALAAVYLKFGRFFLSIDQWKRALGPLTTALELREDYAMALKDRAVAFEHLGRIKSARRDIEAAIQLDPTDHSLTAAYQNLFK